METPPYEWESVGAVRFLKDENQFGEDFGLENTISLPVLNYDTPSPVLTPDQVQTKLEDPPAEKKHVVSVSSTFFPGSHKLPSDTILRSSDSVLFYVNCKVITRTSPDAFRPLLNASLEDKAFRDIVVDISEHSAVLNVILHVFYGISPAKHNPPVEVLEASVQRMPMYGLLPSDHILPSKPLFDLLYLHAPVSAIRIYTLAGEHGLQDLAQRTSSHLLSFALCNLSDDMAKRMGAKYLRRLMALHFNLVEELKRIILSPPATHPVTAECDFAEQKKLSRAWALAASYLAWDSRPGLDLSAHAIQSTFESLGDHLTCLECKVALKTRVKEVLVQWVHVKVLYRRLSLHPW